MAIVLEMSLQNYIVKSICKLKINRKNVEIAANGLFFSNTKPKF